MKKIWLVRHGQSRSQTGETDDSLNPCLTDKGSEQARRLIAAFQDERLDLILISPLQRAWKTYQLSQVQASRVEFDSRLIESDWGIDGFYAPVLPVAIPDFAAPDRHDAWLTSADERAEALVADLVARPADNILLFGHWGIFNRIFWAFTGMDENNKLARATMDNTGISLLEVDDQGYRFIRSWNDRAHLADLLD